MIVDASATFVTIEEEMDLNVDKKCVDQKTAISKEKKRAEYAKKSDTIEEIDNFDQQKVPTEKYFNEENEFERDKLATPKRWFSLSICLLNQVKLLKILQCLIP